MTSKEAIKIIDESPVWDCIDTYRAGVEELNKLNNAINLAIKAMEDLEVCRNELCLRCGEYKSRHLGACDGCRWYKPPKEET
jgi:hypothetical protein